MCAISAPLVGLLGDRIGRSAIMMLGYGTYGLINLWLIFASSPWQIVAAFVAYGLFYAIDEAQTKAFTADIEPERRASAVGIYNFVTGLLYLPASLVAGALWATSPALLFSLAAGRSITAIGLFAMHVPACVPFHAAP